MKITVDNKKILEAVKLASYIVGKKESLPVLSCLLFESKNNSLIIKATNLESGIEIHIPVKTIKPGTCAIPSYILLQTLQSTRTNIIDIEYIEKYINITSGVSTTKINTIPHDEFPSIPTQTKSPSFFIPRDIFISGIRSVAYSAAKSTIRPEFSSIFITYRNGNLFFVATDSFRLSEKKIPITLKKTPEDILIPFKNALDATYILEQDTEENITCTIADSQIHIKTPYISFVSRIVDASFPDYEAIIPKNTSTEIIALKEDVSSVFKKATIFSGDSQQMGFHIYPKKKICTVSARNTTTGEMSDSIDAAVTGEDIDINFNIPFVTDCLQSITTDSVVLRFSGPNKPLVIEGISDKTFRYLVMPLNR